MATRILKLAAAMGMILVTKPLLADIDIDQLAAEKLTWIESDDDRQRVIDYARTGAPQITRQSPGCTSEFPDTIGSGEYIFCVAVEELPADVAEDVTKMEHTRFDNVSDYDQRVTKFLAVRHDGSLHRFLRPNDVRMLASMLDIRPNYVGRIYFSSPAPDSPGYLHSLRSLYVGLEYNDKGTLYDYVSTLRDDQVNFIHVAFGPAEIALFPGGGYTTRFTFFINEKWLIYAKTEGWNS